MMKRIAFFAAIVVLLSACTETVNQTEFGTKLIEKVEKKGDEVIIPYQKWELPNGLTLIIHEDHSDPIVHVDVTYHVGSAREQLGRSGFAHFYEHMMFQGSDHVADEEHIKTVSAAGGQMNGTTNSDRTNYFETLPSSYLETALWLESDRMGYFLDAVTQQKFEVQRATVKNERGQSYDNRPYGLVREKVAQALYPYGHPYSWPTIGYLDELNRATLDDLKNFFLRWYGPNNATLTVAGDVNPEEVIAMAEKYFGPINRGPEVEDVTIEKVTLTGDNYISYEDNIRFPLIQFAFPTVPNRHPDEAPLDVLSEIMGGSKSSIFYQKFIKPQIAINAQVSHPCQELAGQFEFTVLPFPGKTLAEMETLIREVIEEFDSYEISDDDLQRLKSQIEAQTIQQMSSVSGKASMLAMWETFEGNPNYIGKDLERYRNVTKEDVKRVYNQYIKGQHAVVLSVYPKGQPELAAREDNFTPVLTDSTYKADDSEFAELKYVKGEDNFDRSKKPAPGANPTIKLPDYWTATLDNGLEVIGAKNDEVPTFAIRLAIKAGHRFEDPAKAGIASLTASLMTESTEKYTTEELHNKLDVLGSSISATANSEEIIVNINGLKKNLDETLELAQEILFRPKFSVDDFNRLKNQQLEQIANQVTQPVTVASNTFNEILYGKDHIMAIPSIGTTESVASIDLADVTTFYENHLAPNVSRLVIVGDVSKDEILPKLDFMKSWAKKDVVFPEDKPVPAVEQTKIYLVNKPGAPQSQVRIGYMALPYDVTGDYYKARLMNFPLGGAFNSRINLNLREDKGWTYGAGSYFSGSEFAGPFLSYGGIKGNATDSAIVEYMKEIKNYADGGISDDELAFMRSSLGQKDALDYETNSQKAGFMDQILKYDLDKNFIDQQNDILAKITKEEVNELAKKYLPYDKMIIVVVGDKESIYPGLSKLNYEIVNMNLGDELQAMKKN